ncbi:hypothetical protein GCM10027592_08050 [Spirosoma flavus]
MGIANDQLNGTFNTVYGFRDNIPGATDAPSYAHGQGNTLVGANASNYTNGSNNTSLGFNAGGWFLSGSQNVFIGTNTASSYRNTDINGTTTRTLTGNCFLGYQAGTSNQADYNVFIGHQSGYSNVTGTDNVFVGTKTGYANTGSSNTFLGFQAGQSNTTGSNNLFLGWLSGQANTTGLLNVFVGGYTGYNNTSGQLNTFLGYATGSGNTTGRVNTFLGGYAGENNTTGIQNTYVGYQAGQSTTTGNTNTILGYQAGSKLTTGSNNIIIGPSSGTVVQTGSNNIMLGFNAQPTSSLLQNTVAIGTNATVALNNAIVLGDYTNTSIAVGIGTNSPQFPLDVRGTINLRNNGKIKFAHLSNTLFESTTDQFLTVNELGETVLARYRLKIDHVNQWSDKVFDKGYRLPLLTEVEQYIQQYGHLPKVPPAEQIVNEGVDLVQMNALLLEKVEELTLYSIQQDKKAAQQQQRIDQLEAHHKKDIEQLNGLLKQLLEKR